MKVKYAVKPGVCGICGTAVVRPDVEIGGYHSGHLFESHKVSGLILVRVRCMSHKDRADPRYWDDKGELRDRNDWECLR